MTTPSTQTEGIDAGILQDRVRLFLESGHSYPEALRRAHLAPRDIDRQPERWLRAQEAADYLGIGMGDLQRAKAAGLPYHQMENCNGLCLFLASELDRWRRSHDRLPRTPPAPVRRSRYQPRVAVAP